MDNVIEYLLNYALDHGIGFQLMPDAEPDWPSFAVTAKRIVFINTNWHIKKELPFQIAHEIGHVINHDQGVQYYSSPSNHSKMEANANDTAIDILIGYYQANFGCDYISPELFMHQFGIPARYEYQVQGRVATAFGI